MKASTCLNILFLLFTCASPALLPRHPAVLKAPLNAHRSKAKFWVREVPGDGACLFHAMAAALVYHQTGVHPTFNNSLYTLSSRLRQAACDVLSCDNLTLYLGENEECTTLDLLNMVAPQYNKTRDEYCQQMRQPFEWGGGPEIVALCNLLEHPVHIYELYTRMILPKTFQTRPTALFGSPRFDSPHGKPICILCADGRFPGISPGSQKAVGDHFTPLFKVDQKSAIIGRQRAQKGIISHMFAPIKQLIHKILRREENIEGAMKYENILCDIKIGNDDQNEVTGSIVTTQEDAVVGLIDMLAEKMRARNISVSENFVLVKGIET